jgi:hypothetical protein
MADLICSLILFAFAVLVTASYGVLAMLPNRAGNKRLDGHGGILLGRGIMEATYKLFEPLIELLFRAHITPNMVTAFSLVPALASAALVATGHFGMGAILATGSGFCDMFDGMLARRYHCTSDAGELFDAAVDRYVEYFLLAGLAVYFRSSPRRPAAVPRRHLGILHGQLHHRKGGSLGGETTQRRDAPGRAGCVRDLRLRARACLGAGDTRRAQRGLLFHRARASRRARLAGGCRGGEHFRRPPHVPHRRACSRQEASRLVPDPG